MNIVDYTVIADRSCTQLVDLVRRMICIGWQPLGGMQCPNSVHDVGLYCQTLVKYE